MPKAPGTPERVEVPPSAAALAALPIPDMALSLALAVIASSTAPLLLLDGELTIVAASTSFCRAFQLEPDEVAGRQIYTLGDGEWDVPRLRSLLGATIAGDAEIAAYEIDLKRRDRGTRRLVLNAHILDYDDKANVRMLLSVTDVTEARIAAKVKDDLLRDKAVLLQEVQHRVANSLQIIASVLMQSARKVSSEETRAHLNDAHNRVMSIAAVQQQLAVTGVTKVELHGYFTKLCQSLGASMIRDHDALTINVTADASAVTADVSVSLGLIVTELVINALKHAFPANRAGQITVDYRSDGTDWTLAVADDGIGMPRNPEDAKAGLGTSIVQALARQLQAEVTVSDAKPGTRVEVVHTAAAADEIDLDPVQPAV